MGLKDVLAKMKLIEMEEPGGRIAQPSPSKGPAPAQAPGAPPRRPSQSDLQAILASVAKADIPAAAPAGARPPATLNSSELEADFGAVYQLAGVTAPAHGFSALKVLEMLSSEHLASLEPKAKAAALLGFLQMHPNGPVPLRDVIEDAIRRDSALDAYEAALQARLKARSSEIERNMAQLQAEIDTLQRRNREVMDQGLAELEGQRAGLAQWQDRKRQEEQRLFEAVAPFVEANPVTRGDVTEAPSSGATR